MKTQIIYKVIIVAILLIPFSSFANPIIDLEWSTASELNNDFFSIERSVDGISWEEIGIVSGAGNSTNINSYLFSDEFAPETIVYYKLVQTGFDGKSSVSKIISIDNSSSNNAIVIAYPNPTTSFVSLKTDEVIVSALIVNAENTIQKHISQSTNFTNVEDLLPGVYYIVYTTENGSSNSIPFVKL